MVIASIAAACCAGATAIHLLGIAAAASRCRVRAPVRPAANAPGVTIIRPLCGADAYERDTLASALALDYPDYEVIHCVARADDPVVPMVRALLAEAGNRVPASLLVGQDRRSGNPKLDNLLKGWDAARHDWIILADSNVLMPPDTVQRMLARWDPRTGLVCSMPIGTWPGSAGAVLECAFLNTFQARWQYLAEVLGFGFAQGKGMLCRRTVVDRAGGLLAALGGEAAEDAAFTKAVRRQGLRVRLVDAPFPQPLGVRTFRDVWRRQRRWATLRRATFPLMFLPEILTGSVFPIGAGALATHLAGGRVAVVVGALAAVWFGAEAALARRAGWYLTPWLLPALLVRDLLLPVLWAQAWLRHDFEWRGTGMSVAAADRRARRGEGQGSALDPLKAEP